MQTHYTHTQKIPDEILAAATMASLAIGFTPPGLLLRLALWGTLGAATATFRSLTVEVADTNITLRFGDGLVKKSFSIHDVESAQPTRTTPLMGWGIHFVGNGWLYNVYGLDAVELRLFGGKRVLIGTDDTEGLTKAINDRLFRISITSTEPGN